MRFQREESTIALLIGRTVRRIDVKADEVYFVCDDETFLAYHMQDCCEDVAIHDVSGDPTDIIGMPIIEASQDEDSATWPQDVEKPRFEPESFTWTTQKIKAANGREIVIRWLGQSNGYYSESVYFRRTHPEVKP